MLCIKNGTIHDAVHREAYVADILVEDGKICRIGENLEAEETIDASGLNVYPGFVDAHSHIGLDGYGEPGVDINERNDICCPQLRAIDGINPRDPSLADARKAGVTCVCTGPGSANVLGGTFLAMRTVGERVDNMIVRDPVAMKCAFGENPKRCYRDKCDSTRMSTAAFLRGALMQAKDYGARKQAANGDVTKMPAYNQKLEALLPVLDNFDRALAAVPEDEKTAWVDGMKLVSKQLYETLYKAGLEEIQAEGQFDPELHDAVMQEENEDKESGEIIDVFQKGYKVKNRIIRHSMVKVAK